MMIHLYKILLAIFTTGLLVGCGSKERSAETAQPDPLTRDKDASFAAAGAEVDPTTDSDGDGITDHDEIWIHETNPYDPDTDHDGLTDEQEINSTQTDPVDPDSDDDGFIDGEEIARGSDPHYVEIIDEQDYDHDGITDEEEASYGTDPNNYDSDMDGVSDQEELEGPSDPNNPFNPFPEEDFPPPVGAPPPVCVPGGVGVPC